MFQEKTSEDQKGENKQVEQSEKENTFSQEALEDSLDFESETSLDDLPL